MNDNNIYYYGEKNDLAPVIKLQAGSIRMDYENGFLRYLKVGNDEVLRMIYFAVRDPNWDTVEGVIKNDKIEQGDQHFKISYTSEHKKDPIDISFQCLIKGDETGHIEFIIKGMAGSDFKKNRIGFCVLHPIVECMGKICIIGHVDGSITKNKFPELISPHQPFKDIHSMQWPVNEKNQAKIRFFGDIFESEDQRNWTDASYKTYSTPLEIPFPVEVRSGEEVSQRIELDIISDKINVSLEPDKDKLTFSLKEDLGFGLPGLGVGSSTSYDQLDESSVEQIKNLNPDHIRWDLDLTQKDLVHKFNTIGRETEKIGSQACLALFTGENPNEEYLRFAKQAIPIKDRIRHIILFSRNSKTTPDHLIADLSDRIRRDFPGILIGGGTNAYFAELNRERIHHGSLDFIVYSMNPQVHAFDNASLTETLEGQYYTVQSSRNFSSGKDIMISPVTLKPRFNPNATGEEIYLRPGALPSEVDVRQMSLFGACWTLGSIKYLAEAGAKWATYYETAGWRGLIQGPSSPAEKEIFRSKAGDTFPVYFVLYWLKEIRAASIIKSYSSHPLIFDGLTVRKDDKNHIFLVNYTLEKKRIQVIGAKNPILINTLNLQNVRKSMEDYRILDEFHNTPYESIELMPCSINWITMNN